MTLPEERDWMRVEEIANELDGLDEQIAAARLDELRAGGEPETILSLLSSWLSLPPPASPLGPGDVVMQRYTLRQKVGEGGMGSVWRASQSLINRDVAIKVIQPSLLTPAARERFIREMEILGQLEHAGIVKIFDAGIHEHNESAVPFFAMEWVEGISLSKWAATRRNDHAELIRVMSEICAAVQHAHDRRIVHRDLKPSNIMVKGNGQPVILDFGIARLAGGASDEPPGFFSGTPHYAAPEQHLGRDRDFRSGESVDVYAAGAILFEVFTGRRLFDFPRGCSISEMRRAILEDSPARLAEVLPDCPPLLDEIAAKAVRRDPSDRYYSISALARALSRAATQIASPKQIEPPPWAPAMGLMVPGTNWKLTRMLGEGSAGEVWLGEHADLAGRRVFKFCDTEEKARTLKREMTLFRLLKERVGRNPHFIQYHEVSLDEPPFYLMMEDAGALNLSEWCDSQPGGLPAIPVEARVEIVTQAAEALQAAHEAGIIHRDIKPANILVREIESASGNGARSLQVLIADFGIGQIIADELLSGGTRLGFTSTVANLRQSTLSGTMLYLAPEVLEGSATTVRSDVYSLGVVLWQLLTGNLHAALDPANWQSRIADPLLRQVLTRCFTGVPTERWTSAGELATQLRTLPERRASEAHRQADLAARERAAYRRGILRTAAVALVIIGLVAALAIAAVIQRREAQQARALSAMEQAANLLSLGNNVGRRQQGLELLEKAGTNPDTRVELRGLAAGFLSLPDLIPINPRTPGASTPTEPFPQLDRPFTNPGGKLTIKSRPLNEVEGAIDFLNPADGTVRATFHRAEFPWVPRPEPELLRFSPDERLLAVAGPQTSLHLLLCDTKTAALQSYLFTGAGLNCYAWHRGSRIIATGGNDRSVRLWDIHAGKAPDMTPRQNQSFDLPPALNVPTIDSPLLALPGWRGGVCSVAFHPDGTWLAGLDDAGWLRIWSGFVPGGLGGLPPPSEAHLPASTQSLSYPSLLMETKLDRSGPGGRLRFTGEHLLVEYEQRPTLGFTLEKGSAFREKWIAPALRRIAWSDDSQQLCAISGTDIYWVHPDTLAIIANSMGTNPAGVTFDSATSRWVAAQGPRFVASWLSPDRNEKKVFSTPKEEQWSFTPAEKDRAWQLGLASSADRIAIYHGRRLQFARGGKPEDLARSVVTGESGGTFLDLLWDHNGALVTVIHSTPEGLRAESYTTTPDKTTPAGVILSHAQRLVPVGDGIHLVERGVDVGIGLVNARTGDRRSLDSSSEARQNAPLAVSPDGKWIAAVIDRQLIRLLDATNGRPYAELPSPRATGITYLAWAPSGKALATLTEDGFVQTWSLAPWHDWLATHGLY